MKRNIDLTENMTFSRVSIPIQASMINRMIGWRCISTISELENESLIPREKQVISLGNHSHREFIKECKEMDNIYYCDCCGKYLLKKPWKIDGYYTLCESCYNQIEKNIKEKMPWNNR